MVSSLALPFYEKVFANPNTIHPDQLAKSGRKPILVGVDEGTVLSDDTQKIEIYEVRESSHSRGFLMVYVPKDRILIEADTRSCRFTLMHSQEESFESVPRGRYRGRLPAEEDRRDDSASCRGTQRFP